MTFDPDGGVMDEGFELSYGINTGDLYVDILPGYPTATLEGYTLAGWFLEAWNYTFTEGDYNTGYYALSEDCTLVALWEEAAVVECTHSWGEWVVTTEPTATEDGEETRTCSLCGATETQVVPATGVEEPECTCSATVSVTGTTVTVSGLTGTFQDAWIAAGEKTTYDEVKADYLYRVTSTSTKVVDGVWTYDAPAAGTYTVMVRFSDCTIEQFEYIVCTADVEVDKNIIHLENLVPEDIKDIWVSAGEWTEYADVKANMVYRMKGDSYKIASGEWTYMVPENGTYTVYIRYNDGTVTCYSVECDRGDIAEITVDGNTVTFTGLTDFYVLRYAKGEYTSSAQVKRAPDCVNVKPAQVVDGTWSVELEAGTYTFVTQFTDGNFVYYNVTIA